MVLCTSFPYYYYYYIHRGPKYITRHYVIGDNLDWATMEQRLYQDQDQAALTKIHDIDELREQLTATWHNLEQSIIDSAINQWRKRLTACVRPKADTLNISYNLLHVNIILLVTVNEFLK